MNNNRGSGSQRKAGFNTKLAPPLPRLFAVPRIFYPNIPSEEPDSRMKPPSAQHAESCQPVESLRFALLEHDHPVKHWDLLLQQGNRLLGWRGDPQGHFLNGGLVVQTADHRMAFLDYEGPLTGDRGSVRRIDSGPLKWRRFGLDLMEAEIQGLKWRGVLKLKKIAGNEWTVQLRAMPRNPSGPSDS